VIDLSNGIDFYYMQIILHNFKNIHALGMFANFRPCVVIFFLLFLFNIFADILTKVFYFKTLRYSNVLYDTVLPISKVRTVPVLLARIEDLLYLF
jgi:hypothetical protein